MEILELLRSYAVNRKKIGVHEGYAYFGGTKIPMSAETSFLMEPRGTCSGSRRRYHTLESIMFCVEKADLPYTHYAHEARGAKLTVVEAFAKRDLIDYLQARITISEHIDRRAHYAFPEDKPKEKAIEEKPSCGKEVEEDEDSDIECLGVNDPAGNVKAESETVDLISSEDEDNSASKTTSRRLPGKLVVNRGTSPIRTIDQPGAKTIKRSEILEQPSPSSPPPRSTPSSSLSQLKVPKEEPSSPTVSSSTNTPVTKSDGSTQTSKRANDNPVLQYADSTTSTLDSEIRRMAEEMVNETIKEHLQNSKEESRPTPKALPPHIRGYFRNYISHLMDPTRAALRVELLNRLLKCYREEKVSFKDYQILDSQNS